MTVDEMERVLDELGIEYVSSRGDEVQGFCPGHLQRTGHEDKNPSWYINSETGAHICFSCQFKGSVSYLVAFVKNLRLDDGMFDLDAAKDWLSKGGELSEAFERAVKPKETFDEIVYVSEATLAAFTEPPDFALKARGLTLEASNKYELLWSNKQQNWIIPLRDVSGKLMGWQEKAYSGRYFKNCPTGVKKSTSLFGLAQYSGGDMIVVESPLDVVRLESIGITGGVATYGSMVSDLQVSTIRERADRIVFAMDADEAGLHSSLQLLEKTKELCFEAWFFNYADTDMKDVGGMSKGEVLQGIAEAKHSVRYAAWGAA
jgi:DNA primase